MSGPKAWMFTPLAPAILRSFNIAFAEIETLEQEWVAATRRVHEAMVEFGAADVHVSLERPPVWDVNRKVTLEVANRHAIMLRGALARVESELQRESARHRRTRQAEAAEGAAVRSRANERIADLLAEAVRYTAAQPTPVDVTHGIAADTAETPVPVPPSSTTERDVEAEAEDAVARVLGRLSPDVPELVREAIMAIATKPARDAVRIDARLAEVRRRVQEANQAAQRWPDEVEALHLLLLQVRAFEAEPARAWARELESAIAARAPLTTARRAEAEAFVLAEAAAEERRTVQRALGEVLSGLGYEVGDTFETLFVDGGSVYVQRPSWGEYFVRWRVDGESGEANTNVVRAPSADGESAVDRARRDREIEEAWCSDAAGLRAALAERGIDANLLRAMPAGALPVPELRQSSMGSASSRATQGRRTVTRRRER